MLTDINGVGQNSTLLKTNLVEWDCNYIFTVLDIPVPTCKRQFR